MSVQSRSNNSSVPFIRSGVTYIISGVIKQDAGRAAVLEKHTIMGKSQIVAGAVTPDGGNTGNGTVTGLALAPGGPPQSGSYNLEAVAIGSDGRKVGAVTPDGGNTGNGTVTGFAVVSGEVPEIGNWILKCIDENAGGTASSTSVTITGTGDGTPGSVTPAADIVEGLYTLTCVEAITNKGRFEVADPNGNRLEDLNITEAYSNSHFALTVQDGSSDYIVGDTLTFTITIAHGGKFKLTDPDGVDVSEDLTLPGTPGGTLAVSSGGIEFTITDGGTDFADDDFFTLVIAVSDGGVFKLETPGGEIIKNDITLPGDAGGTITVIIAGMTFIITDGSTDFISGDKFALPFTADSDYVPLDPDVLNGGQSVAGIYLGDEILVATIVAGDVSDSPVLVGGNCTIDTEQVVLESGTLATILPSGKSVRDELSLIGIFVESTVDIDGFEN